MKPRCSNQNNRAQTLTEVLVVIVVLAVLVAVFLPTRTRIKDGRRSVCVQNLKDIALASFVWAGDHGDKFPTQVSVTNWGARELALAGDIAGIFCTMSNELNSPKHLYCPQDKQHKAATDFGDGFNRSNISYFIGVDAEFKGPQMILVGDDNLQVNGKSVQPGILNLQTNATIEWAKERHQGVGNIALADGSVAQISSATLQQTIQPTGVATNRLAIP